MKARLVYDDDGQGYGYEIKCPGCGFRHHIPPGWWFNGDTDLPTFSPSIKLTWRTIEDQFKADFYSIPKPLHTAKTEERCCHFHITDGKIQFCGDCTHALAGQELILEDW